MKAIKHTDSTFIFGVGKTKRPKIPEEKGEILVFVKKKRPIVVPFVPPQG